MTRRRKILIACASGLLLAVGYFVFSVVYTWQHIPEAYAAWDTGSLLVVYMRTHEGHWPSDWDDLLTVLEGEQGQAITLYGSQAGDIPYANSLRNKVTVDWSFDPKSAPKDAMPVTRSNGRRFPIVWAGAEPNEMVRRYIASRAEPEPSMER